MPLEELTERELVRSKAPERTAPRTAEAAIRWIEQQSTDRPFFLWVHFQDPHGPYAPPDAYVSRFVTSRRGTRLPACAENDNRGEGCIPWYQRVTADQALETYVDRYDAEIAYADPHVGRVLDVLRERPGWKDMVVTLTADHGEAMGEAGFYFRHGHAVTRDQSGIPMILKHPDLVPGGRVRAPVGHVDLYPTFAEMTKSTSVEEGIWGGLDLMQVSDADPPQRVLYCDRGGDLAVHLGRHVLTGRVRKRGAAKTAATEDPESFVASGVSDYWAGSRTIENADELESQLAVFARQ